MQVSRFLTAKEITALQKQEAQSDKEPKRTPEQIEAIYTNGQNVLVSASAGSGKTFVMVERIVDKLCRGIAIDQLFISTFTVKAAGELKERIEGKLNQVLLKTTDEALRRHLLTQLSKLSHADIGTMDAFTQKLVTTYGYTLGISPHFRILQDKNEQDILKNEVFSDLFADYYQKVGDFSALVRNFSGNRKDNMGFREVVYQIHRFSQSTSHPEIWLRETFLKGYERYSSLSSLPLSLLTGLLENLKQTAEDLEELTELEEYKKVTAKGSPTVAYQKHQLLIQQLRDIARIGEEKGLEQLPQLTSQVVDLLPSGAEVTVSGIKYPVYKSLKTRLQDMQHLETILRYQPKALPLLHLLQSFLLDFSQQYFQRKMQENSYEFTDISHLAIQILEENPEIRSLFQEKYEEVMVDEYQDNNHMQERMLDLFSNGHNRFMVGDIKQSIYRFRQADPQIFQAKFDLYRANPEAGKLILLKENFRSQKEVLDATNALFTRLMDKEIGDIVYDETHTLVAGSERQQILHPHHQMEYLLYDSEAAEETTDLTAGEVELVAKEIIRLYNEEKVSFSQITLLVPSRTRNEQIIASFERHGIPLVTDGGEVNYLQSLEVMVMLDTLRTINNPLQDYALVALLKSPMFQFTEDELTRIALQAEAGFFYEKLEKARLGQGKEAQLISPSFQKKLQSFHTYLTGWRTFAKLQSIHDLIWKIFNEKFYYDYVRSLPNGEKRQANLYALGLRANQFEQTGFKGLARFIAMIDTVLANQNDLASVEVALPQDAVQLMTIHKSKGLEFPYVFLLNMDKDFNAVDSRSPVICSRENGVGIQYLADMKPEFDTPLPHVRVLMNTLPYQIFQRELKLANLSEQMRLLYVALTRAEKKLYLVGKGSKEKLATKYDGKQKDGILSVTSREKLTNFQDWVLAIAAAFEGEELHFKQTLVTDTDLTTEQIAQLQLSSLSLADRVKDNRQSEDIREALERLGAVEELNQRYQAAIHLPSLRTPSQIKDIYKPVFSEEEVNVMEVSYSPPRFDLPNLGKKRKVTGAAVGSALHALMQAIDLTKPVTLQSIEETIKQLEMDTAIADKMDRQKIVAFFQTPLGQEMQAHPELVRREVPFASLQQDSLSGEQFVLRGIVDGFMRYPDRIILFDYKTDRYTDSQDIRERYQIQMELYKEALSKAYAPEQIDIYLILLGGEELEVVQMF